MLSTPAFKSTSESSNVNASEIRSPVQAIRPNRVCMTAPRGLIGGPMRPAASQCGDLLVAEDVRRHTPRDWAEDRFVGHLGGRLELLQPAREGPQHAQRTGPCGPVAPAALGLPSP
jgi:hypothetical protein